MQDRKKILVLTPRFPYPVIGGDRLRIYYICRELAKEYDLTLLSLCESREEMEMDIPLDGVFSKIERVMLPKWKSYLNCLFSLPTNTPLQVAYYSSQAFKKKVDELLSKHDLALAHLIRTGHYLRDFDTPKVLEMTDAISMNYERVGAIEKSSGFKNLVYSVEQDRLKKYEQSIAHYFDLSVFVSQVDKDYLYPKNSEVRNKVLVCSNGVSFDALPCNYQPDGKTIVFIGNMTTVQNLDAARWFAKSVMPGLTKIGDYQFKVIGRIKEQVKNEFNRYANTIATGSVDSVAEAAAGAITGVCPMRLGAGVQNKVLEYMALGMPAITSSVGLEGIEAEVGKEILVADSVNEYINMIQEITNNIKYAEEIGYKGNQFVLKENTWSGKLKPLIEKINKLVL
ncbi:glycosyl transferase family 1 [Saccharobesus litoralis]|uniref:Glycosyl transferase family 1 n=1 Tax=Saccharobesus litoralis TaxID=2172099 RepID=A0A2S0VRD2_9ALTE|nr:glycosyltransferase family 4 protein [Saccharobesus litoralis]AWB66759.1 glycosyl transferase family 1 [Saccharobesus litoralis]